MMKLCRSLCILTVIAACRCVCGEEPPGVVIDRSPDFASVYVGCPSIAILPNGGYVASHSWFGRGTNNDTSEVFGSWDRGLTWETLATLRGQWWSSLFVHRGSLYIFGVSREYGRIVIRRSIDGGRTWTEPNDANTGLLTEADRYHCAPVPIALHDGRIWRAFELAKGPRPAWSCLVVSAADDGDLLRADNWRMSEPLGHLWSKSQWIEGNVLTTPQGQLVNLLRTNGQGNDKAVIVHIADDGRSLSHDPACDGIEFPGGGTKFTVRFDAKTARYWSIANKQTDPPAFRNVLVLASSSDLRQWKVERTLLRHADSKNHAWQYVDWQFDGDDLVAVSRTAWDGSHNAHDANYFTFHRIRDFRQLTSRDSATEIGVSQPVTVLLQGGTIYDGAGGEGVAGDVAFRDGRITAVGQCDAALADRVIDCRGLIVAPGFIDLHTHCDPLATDAKVRANLNYLTQGCTSVVTGNCGGGALDVEEYFANIDRQGAGTNVIHLVPHGAVRAKAVGRDDRKPTPEELQRMRELVDRGMRAGAWGMSTGLIYAPGMFAKTDELIDLAKIVARHGGIYASHIRGEGSGLLKSVQEAIDIGRAAGLPVEISHFKIASKAHWGLVRQAAAMVEDARRGGLTVTADQYPYVATSTGLGPTLFSPTQIPGGMKDFAKRMAADPDFKHQVHTIVQRELHGASRIVVASCKKFPEYVGKSLDEIAAQRGIDAAEVAIDIQVNGSASVVKFTLSEDDVRYVMTIPWVATASDGGPQVPNPATCPHPRSYGTFPRKIGYYAIQENVISPGQAIRSASGLPADILKLVDRGYLRSNLVADIVVFDPKTFIDRATFDKPHQYSTGVRYVFLGGHAAIDDGKPATELYGRAIRHPDPK